MTYQVTDSKTGQPVKNAFVQAIDTNTGQLWYEPIALDQTAMFEVEPQQGYGVKITAIGYKDLIVNAATLAASQDGQIMMQQSFPTAVVLMALLAIYAYRKKSGKVGKLDQQDIKNIMLATGGIIGFALIKQLLEFLGIWTSREEQQLDNAATNPNSFWNPNFWRTKPAYIEWTAPITDQEAQALAKQIYNSISVFNDNETAIKAIFRQFRAQSSVSYLAAWFAQLYNRDLLSFLRGGTWPMDGLSDADLNEINIFISKLPKY